MCRIDVVVAKDKKDEVITRIHKEGIAQVETITEKEIGQAGIGRDKPLERAVEVDQLLYSVQKLKESLKPYVESKQSFLDELLGVEQIPTQKVDDLDHKEIEGRTKILIQQVEEKIKKAMDRQKQLDERRTHLADELKRIKPLSGLDLPLQAFEESALLHTVLGSISSENLGHLKERMTQEFGLEYAVSQLAQDGDIAVLSVTTPKEDAKALNHQLRIVGFDQIHEKSAKSFRNLYESLCLESEIIEQKYNASVASLHQLAAETNPRLLVSEELLLHEQQRCNIFTSFGSTKTVTYLRLWVPQEKKEITKHIIAAHSCGQYSLDIDEDPQDAPTLLDNPPALKPFEVFTNMFSTPRYNQIDPTPVTAPTFVIFFGFMLGDAVYGTLLTAASFWLAKKYKSHQNIVDFTHIIFWCGLSTILFGILTGSFLGNFLTKYVLGVEAQSLKFVLLDPLYKSNAITLLVVALAAGLTQVVFGHVLGFFDKLKSNNLRGALTENLCWLLILFGLGLAYFTKPVFGIGPALLGVILLFNGSGVMAVLELPGIMSRIVSYARLLALNLTTPGMGMAFNTIASMIWAIPYIGAPLSGLFFIASHLIILLINSLGSFVHSLRLHYVEYYGTFYSGGGVSFTPFKEQRKYTTRR
jgi:V/A-type H+-transporting ATPase subunit I